MPKKVQYKQTPLIKKRPKLRKLLANLEAEAKANPNQTKTLLVDGLWITMKAKIDEPTFVISLSRYGFWPSDAEWSSVFHNMDLAVPKYTKSTTEGVRSKRRWLSATVERQQIKLSL
jgi:hypothetical protein